MTHRRTKPALPLEMVVALGLLIIGGCDTPVPMTPLEQARAAFAGGQWAESIMFCTEAISQHPDDVRGYVLRGRAFRRLGQVEPAITDFTVAIQLNPTNPEFYYLRAEAYKDRKDIDLADADDKAGQKLDPSYQRAYLYAPPDGTLALPPIAEELSRTLRDDDKDSADEPGEIASRLLRRRSAQGEAGPEMAVDLSPDELVESAAAPTWSPDEPEVKDVYGLPVASDLNRPTGGLFSPGAVASGPSAAETGNYRTGPAGRHAARRKPISAELDPPALSENEPDPRSAQSGGAQRGSGNAGPNYYPPQRSIHPFGVAAMRPTGVPSEQFDEESMGEDAESGGGYRGARGQGSGGGGRSGGSQFGSSNSNATGGRGYGASLDPYGGYTRSARPIGALTGNPYGGGGSPYGPGGSQGAAGRRRGSVPRDADAGGGSAPPNPYGPLPAAPVPYIDPPGLRYDQ
jgi:hypothetical protein